MGLCWGNFEYIWVVYGEECDVNESRPAGNVDVCRYSGSCNTVLFIQSCAIHPSPSLSLARDVKIRLNSCSRSRAAQLVWNFLVL